MSDFRDDPLDDLLSGAAPTRAPVTPPASFQPKTFEEGCDKCHGTGRFTSWSGRQLGECFACKGRGSKAFKTSSADRAKARVQADARKVRKAVDAWETFKADHPEVAAWIDANPKFDFAVKMREAVLKWGSLTAGQMAACERLVARQEARNAERAERAASAPSVDVSVIEQAFATAKAKAIAKNPKATGVRTKPLKLKAGDVSLGVTAGSAGSVWEGMLFFKTVEGKKLGSVKDGRFQARWETTEAEKAAVLECVANPKDAVIAFAQAWKLCGICNRTLTAEESIERGIGPICLGKFGW